VASDLAAALAAVDGAALVQNVPLAGLTTWRVGGPARYLLDVKTAGALVSAVEILAGSGTERMVIGRGSNLLVSDDGFDGAVLRLREELASIRVDGLRVTTGGGATLMAAVNSAYRANLSGLEFATGIPGTAGGAVMTNAGAFTGCTADVLERVEALGADGRGISFDAFEGGYRTPLVPEATVVTSVCFRLSESPGADIKMAMEEMRRQRSSTQPLAAASAGSVFKNPEGESAGRLIDECGLKGVKAGGASVSTLHANFIINEGGASADDILRLMVLIAGEVEAKHGIRLEREVRLVGFREET
jgi:UDP-N-acetylmuramate dehydrogenase